MSDTEDPLPQPDLPPDLRFLKILVIVLTGTMILGLIAILSMIVIRLPGAMTARPTLPDQIVLPEGTRAGAVTFGRGWYAVVTETGDAILIFDAETGALRQSVTVAD